MAIGDAISQVGRFKGESLTRTISGFEVALADASASTVRSSNQRLGVDHSLLLAAAAIKQASAQIDVVIHTVGILYALPHILRQDEVVESLSLGAGSAHSDADLVTDRRIGEFKFICWQAKGNAVRNKTLFEDYFRLIREQTDKEKYLYLLETETPLRFLRGGRDPLKVLDRNKRLADDFVAGYGQSYGTVGEFFEAHQEEVQIVNLTEVVPGFDEFMAIFR